MENNLSPIEVAQRKLVTIEEKIRPTKEALDLISEVPRGLKIAVRPGNITFKIQDPNASFKSLVDEIKAKFRVTLHKDFDENKGNYLLEAQYDGVRIRIADIPPPPTCEIRVREVDEVKKKKQYLPFGECTMIVR